ncbi:60S ribosomal protein L7a-2-like isoform X2 [Cucumis melo var. makuwa]|uniref:60S ribosomal protein L7a n=1 Tax=Cucumis melo var. makuwa TaxID=1194695 RepID=A0A5A7VJ69_CUCMM|nr:60S ribosomal protein L7a-2-like isoform X2 [Cucumis melo var. makuwa]TYK08749.1 60S ribosomal protein L7a-2-like isoform X2 [Cucumis melo var. makuwa]
MHKQRLKIPPSSNQFTKTFDKNLATNLFKMLLKYRAEDKSQKRYKWSSAGFLKSFKGNFNKYDDDNKKWGGGNHGLQVLG